MTSRPAPLRVSTSLAILVFDWLIFALNLGSRLHDMTSSTLVGVCGVALTVALIEQRKETEFKKMFGRAMVAAAIVAVPLPLLGTLVAATCLIWSAVAHAQSQRTH